MKLCGACVTYNRPLLLGRLIHCFLQQTQPGHRLFILDDGGQYDNLTTGNLAIRSTSIRYGSLGEKRNAAINYALACWPDTEGIATADDDDVYWPHWLESVSSALDKGPWAQARLVFEPEGDAMKVVRTENADPRHAHELAYGATWAWRVDAYRQAGGFSPTPVAEEIGLAERCYKLYGPSTDSSPFVPWFFHNRRPGQMWELGDKAYEARRNDHIEYVGTPPLGWNGENIYERLQLPGIHPRPF